jgi:hypothetical protein
MIDVFDKNFEDNVIDFQINESELEEKAGVRFVKNSKEYNISRII